MNIPKTYIYHINTINTYHMNTSEKIGIHRACFLTTCKEINSDYNMNL